MRDFFRLWVAFLRRDFLHAASYRMSFVFGLVPLFFYLVVFFFMGKIFSGLGSGYLAGYGGEYFPFVVVGLAVQNLAGAGLTGFSQAIANEQYVGTLEPVLAAGRGAFRVLAAASLARNTLSSTRLIFYLVAAAVIFGVPFRPEGIPLFLAVVLITAAAYFGLGMLSAAFVLAYKQGNPVNIIFGELSAVLAGVYFPLAVLPGWLRAVAKFLPLTYALEVARRALLTGGPAPPGTGRGLLILGCFAAASLAVGAAAFRWAFRRARREGSLAWY